MIRSRAIRDSAKNEDCTMNIMGVCNYDPSTTVFAHLNESFAGKGMGLKANDIGMYACSNCHSHYDRGKIVGDKYFYLLRAVYRTWVRMVEKGLITMKGVK